jgi:hypothetical protein
MTDDEKSSMLIGIGMPRIEAIYSGGQSSKVDLKNVRILGSQWTCRTLPTK